VESALGGLIGGSTLVIGALIGIKAHWSTRVIGLDMAFGAGVLIASLACELVDDAALVGTLAATADGLACPGPDPDDRGHQRWRNHLGVPLLQRGSVSVAFHSSDVATLRLQYPDHPVLHERSDDARLVVSEPLGDL
jgi:hypothetical protein